MENTDAHFSGQWKSGGHDVLVDLPLIIFFEDNYHIVFCPALDISSAGKTESEAMDAFQDSLGEFLLYTVRKRTLLRDLEAHGWTVKKSLHKQAIPPNMSYLLDNNDEFKRVFDNFDYRKVNHTVQMPALA